MDPHAERSHDEGDQHPDRERDARQDPRKFVEMRGAGGSHRSSPSPELKVGIGPKGGQDREVDQHEQQRALRVIVLIHFRIAFSSSPSLPGSQVLDYRPRILLPDICLICQLLSLVIRLSSENLGWYCPDLS
jgi:hypothetical protein